MKSKTIKSSAGPKGDSVRSDCYIEFELKESSGIKLNLKSKVESMYGDSIRELILNMCKFFNLKNAKIKVEDYGALPFTLAARFETAIKKDPGKTSSQIHSSYNHALYILYPLGGHLVSS